MPTTIRLFDFGGDKIFRWIPGDDIRLDFAMRGSRLYGGSFFDSLITDQLDSIDILAERFDISILVPYVSNPSEFVELRTRINSKLNRRVKIGAMLETVAMVYSLKEVAQFADFIAIGSNDLLQSFFDVSRTSEFAAKYYLPYSPSLLRLFNELGLESLNLDIPVRICGQLPLLAFWFPLLLGFGFREFSVEPFALSALRGIAKNSTISDFQSLAQESLKMFSSSDVIDLLERSTQLPQFMSTV